MSIYSTPLPQLKTADLEELLVGRAVENTRLEFKREVPDKDETLKKLSSFANTFGGYLVVVTGPSFCTTVSERVYITAIGCES